MLEQGYKSSYLSDKSSSERCETLSIQEVVLKFQFTTLLFSRTKAETTA